MSQNASKTVFAALLILIAGIIIYFLFFFGNTENPKISPSPTNTPSPTPSPSAIAQPTPAKVNITIQNFAFQPDTITINTGTTVIWTNQDSVNHTVTSNDNIFDSGLFGKDGSFQYTFISTGTFNYFCIPHPFMKAVIIVK